MIAPDIEANLVDACIERVLSFGLLVRLNDGRLGIIREREIAWDTWSLRLWRRHFRPGTHLRAMPLGEGLDGRLELSLRLAEHDPWDQIETKYPLGKLVTGTITGIQPYGLFIELEPGLTGLMHRSRLPLGFETLDLTDLFWCGDSVRVVIERIDPRNRHIGLNLRRALSLRWPDLPQSLSDASLVRIDEAHPSGLLPSDELVLPSWRILIVEDDPAERAVLTHWMQQSQLMYLEAESAERALELVQDERVDLILTDIGLPGMSGLELVEHLKHAGYVSRYALMTDWSRASNYTDQITQLQHEGVIILLKPLRPADMLDLLTRSFTDIPELQDSNRSNTPKMLIQAEQIIDRLPWEQNLRKLLFQLQQGTGASDAVLFELNAGQRRVSIIAHVGNSTLASDALLDLIHSPVRDVAEDRVSCHIDDSNNAETRIRYLKPLLPFRTCLGMSIPSMLANRYALFLFSQRAQAFSTQPSEQLSSTCLTIAILLEHAEFQKYAGNIQHLALLGQLSRALVHEMNHHLSPINFTAHDMQQQLIEYATHDGDFQPTHLTDLHEIFNDLMLGIERLTSLSKTFSQLTVQSQEPVLDLSTVLNDVLYLLRDTSDRAHIRLLLNIPPNIPLLQLNALQFQQMVLNMTLNAIQQIAELRPMAGGCIQLQIEYSAEQGRLSLFIEDDGPGIHRQLWDRIYDLGFTTRKVGGSGLGLYITRSLAEALGGTLKIAESHMLWGTRFLLELPARVM